MSKTLSVIILCLICCQAEAFQALIRSQDTVFSPSRSVDWLVTTNATEGICFSLDGKACVGTVRSQTGKYELVVGTAARHLQGKILYDENAELPWNMLWPEVTDTPFDISMRTGEVYTHKAYQLRRAELNSQEAARYGIATENGRSYILMQVWRGSELLAEQIWISGEDIWILDITRTQRSERITYAP